MPSKSRRGRSKYSQSKKRKKDREFGKLIKSVMKHKKNKKFHLEGYEEKSKSSKES